MTIFDSRTSSKVVPAEISWTTPDENLWVATVDGDYAGMIEFDNGHFLVRNKTNNTIATRISIPTAQDALTDHVRSRALPAAARFFNALTQSERRSPFLDRRPRPGYARGKLQRG
jgi:hypothetical protein